MCAWSCRWNNLPDPSDERAPHGSYRSVELHEWVCRHIVEKHVLRKEEPWTELLEKELVKRLQKLLEGEVDFAQRAAALDRFSEGLSAAARECLEQPLVLLLTQPAVQSGHQSVQCWQLVLRCGALMVIEVRRRATVKTCFFPRSVCRVPKGSRRWRHLLAALVLRYARMRNGKIEPPRRGEEVRQRSGKAWAEARFVTLESWGFRTDMEGTPWRGRPAAWPAEGDARPSARRRLLPRRLVEDEAYGYS